MLSLSFRHKNHLPTQNQWLLSSNSMVFNGYLLNKGYIQYKVMCGANTQTCVMFWDRLLTVIVRTPTGGGQCVTCLLHFVYSESGYLAFACQQSYVTSGNFICVGLQSVKGQQLWICNINAHRNFFIMCSLKV